MKSIILTIDGPEISVPRRRLYLKPELSKEEITCAFCESGCKFEINFKNGKVVGVTAKSPAHGLPLCLKGLNNPNLHAG